MKGEFVVRRADIQDLEGILKLNFKLFKNEYRYFDKTMNVKWTYSEDGRKYFTDMIKKKDKFAGVIEHNGKIIGYLCGGIFRKSSSRKKAKYAELENIFIDDKFRGMGLGTDIINYFKDWCKKKEVNRVAVLASASNEGAIRLYRKHGFKDHELWLEMKLK